MYLFWFPYILFTCLFSCDLREILNNFVFEFVFEKSSRTTDYVLEQKRSMESACPLSSLPESHVAFVTPNEHCLTLQCVGGTQSKRVTPKEGVAGHRQPTEATFSPQRQQKSKQCEQWRNLIVAFLTTVTSLY